LAPDWTGHKAIRRQAGCTLLMFKRNAGLWCDWEAGLRRRTMRANDTVSSN
jgi:hypothetical protein